MNIDIGLLNLKELDGKTSEEKIHMIDTAIDILQNISNDIKTYDGYDLKKLIELKMGGYVYHKME